MSGKKALSVGHFSGGCGMGKEKFWGVQEGSKYILFIYIYAYIYIVYPYINIGGWHNEIH
jgi:hypothetical protein